MVLSYRHAFHVSVVRILLYSLLMPSIQAGGTADVLKHAILTEIFSFYTRQGSQPLLYVDTHAGAGRYSLYSGYATKLQEHKSGIDEIYRGKANLYSSLNKYIDTIKLFNHKESKIRIYPGSPLFALAFLRKSDSAYLYELHSSDFKLLKGNCSNSRAKVNILQEDGLQGLQYLHSIVTFQNHNKVILIDPSYELRTDYEVLSRTIWSVKDRFAKSCCAIWYPMLTAETKSGYFNMLQSLKTIPNLSNWINAGIFLPNCSNFNGMYGSGMIVFNPPETVSHNMKKLLPILAQNLKGKNESSYDYTLECGPGCKNFN